VSDETGGAIRGSLETHPTLQVLHLWSTPRLRGAPLAPAVLKFQIQALVDMLKVSMSIHTIRLLERYYSNHELFRESVMA
jgi:hypothetical protein